MNGYFDGKDFNTPIKEYLDDRLYDYPIYDQRKYVFTYIGQNTALLQDDIYQYSSDQIEKTFNGILINFWRLYFTQTNCILIKFFILFTKC